MIEALLVANRGEIAVRAFRAANELGVRSIAVYVPEDRDSVHRLKADESYEIGEPGHPVSNYLDAQLIVDLAVAVGPHGQGLAAWSQGTLNPSVVGAVN